MVNSTLLIFTRPCGPGIANSNHCAKTSIEIQNQLEVGPAAEPACAKAAGSLRSPGQCDGAGGGSRRAPGLDLRAGLGSGAVLSVRGGPTVEWQP